MPFSLIHKIASYLLVATGLIALFASQQFSWLTIGICSLSVVGSWWWEPPRVEPSRFDTVWNIATVLFLGKVVVDITSGHSVLIAAIEFVLYLGINKLFNRTASADYLHLYVLGFLQMVAATVLSTDLLFGVLFVFYIVFLTWALFLFHLKREMEENFLLKYRGSLEGRPVKVQRVLNSRRLVGLKFLGSTSLVAIVVFLGAVVFFVSFPRIGLRMFNQRRAGIAMTGFSNQLELGHFGRIKDDPTVVLRVEFDSPQDRAKLPPYWRGISFDRYDGRTWSKSKGHERRPLLGRGGRYIIRPDGPEKGIRQSVYVEPMETRVLFGLSRIDQVNLPHSTIESAATKRHLYQTTGGDLHYEQRDEIAFRYEVTSHSEHNASALDTALEPYRGTVKRASRGYSQRTTQIPKGLSKRIRKLGTQVVGDATTVLAAVERIENHLRKNYRYTLDLGRDPSVPPLDDFLFVQRKGHCEYFSSAMVILLRSQGIAARSVNGFYGGEWNQYGNYLAIRQGDAHSWVEVGLPVKRCPRAEQPCYWDFDWLTRDPTPPSSSTGLAETSIWDTFRQYADALRMRWYRNVIEYDIEQQIGFAATMKAAWNSLFGDKDEASTRAGSQTKSHLRHGLIWILGSILALAVMLLLYRRFGRRNRARLENPVHRGTRLFEGLVNRYTHLGYPRQASLTAREYVAELGEKNAPELDVAQTVLEHYEAARFGNLEVDRSVLQQLRRRISAVKAPSP